MFSGCRRLFAVLKEVNEWDFAEQMFHEPQELQHDVDEHNNHDLDDNMRKYQNRNTHMRYRIKQQWL